MTTAERMEKCARRYTAQHASKARKLHESGWTVSQITTIFNGEGVPVHSTTVRRWVDPGYAERQRRLNQQRSAEERSATNGGRLRGCFSRPEFKLARIQGLADAGVPPRTIPAVMRFDFPDLALSYDQVRYALATGRLPMLKGQP